MDCRSKQVSRSVVGQGGGTGVTAAVLAFDNLFHPVSGKVAVHTLGGDLAVSFKRKDAGGYADIWLHGPAVMVYKGEIEG